MMNVASPPAELEPRAGEDRLAFLAQGHGAGGPTRIQRLADALRMVRQRCPTLALLGIRWMHLKHPLHPVQETLIQSDGHRNPEPADGWTQLWLVIRCLLYALSSSARLVWLQLVLRQDIVNLKRQAFALIAKTCCFGPGRLVEDSDFYYGDLQRRLHQRGLRMLLLCGDVLCGRWTTFAKGQVGASWPRLSELCLVHPLAPLGMMWNQLRTCRRLRGLAAQSQEPLTRRISRLASRECLTPETMMAGLGFWVGRTAVRLWRPRAFLTLYEGHAWESCMRWGVKEADPSCLTVGYQHTMVFRESLALLEPSTEGRVATVPDVVLCLGAVPRELMRRGHEPFRTRLIRFGSFRFHATPVERPADPARRTVLVTPEGIPSEVEALFTFAYACARQLPSHTFILRCHPEVPMSRAIELVSVDLARQPNIILSDQRIEEDFARASVLLYRGSSAALYAVLHGLLPVYVQMEGRRDRDPLYQLETWRRHCRTPESVEECLSRYERQTVQQLVEEWTRAVEYVGGCVEPVADDRLEAFLDAVGLNGKAR
jgi:hypothetical protein